MSHFLRCWIEAALTTYSYSMEDEDWLLGAGPDPGLLETDIRSRSFNVAPWDGKDPASAPWKSSKLILSEDNPFSGMVGISDTSKLSTVTDRTVCPECKKSRKYYCYTCYVPVKETRDIIPQVTDIDPENYFEKSDPS